MFCINRWSTYSFLLLVGIFSWDLERILTGSSVLVECLLRVLRLRLELSLDGERRRDLSADWDLSRPWEMDLECSRDFERLFDFSRDWDRRLDRSLESLSFDESIFDFSFDNDLSLLDFLSDRRIDLPSRSLSSDLLEDRDFLPSESLLESFLFFFEWPEVLSCLLLFRLLLCFMSLLFSLLGVLDLKQIFFY